MESLLNSDQTFGEKMFSDAQLGDKRRTRRLAALADDLQARPGGTLPHKLNHPADLVALYRLCKRPEVTHGAIMRPAGDSVIGEILSANREVLILHDATELDYTAKKSVADLGQLGNGHCRGYIAHNSLAVDPARGEAIGLVNQILHRRDRSPKTETRGQARDCETRESRPWVRGTESLPEDRRLIDVCDAGADTFEFLEHESQSRRRFVIRSGYQRRVLAGHEPNEGEQTAGLYATVRAAASLGTRTITIPKKVSSRKKKRANGKPKHPPRRKREAVLHSSFAKLRIRAPKAPRGAHGDEPLPVWVVRVWEPDPPEGVEPLEWILLTNEPVASFAEAIRVVDWYRLRWVVEEYHKALKTGCGIETFQFHSRPRLEPAIALISVVATTLLKLRDAGRAEDARKRPATELIGRDYIEALSLWRHREVRLDWSVYDFVLALGRLGGHLNRKRDGMPGWITLWRGWTELVGRVAAIRDYKKHRRKCA